MAKVNLDVPDDLHRQVKLLQIQLEEKDQKLTMKDLYYLVIEKGLKAFEMETKK